MPAQLTRPGGLAQVNFATATAHLCCISVMPLLILNTPSSLPFAACDTNQKEEQSQKAMLSVRVTGACMIVHVVACREFRFNITSP